MRNCFRALARANMMHKGIKRINKPDSKHLKHASPSYFAAHWLAFAVTPPQAVKECKRWRAEDERRRERRAERRAARRAS